MPDQSDVEQALANWVVEALYPEGSSAASPIGTECRVYRGSPVTGALEKDLFQNVAHITVQVVQGSSRDATRYSTEWQGASPVCPLIAGFDGDTVTFTGQAGPGMVAGVLVDGRAYAWRVPDVSTPGVVAAVLAGLVRVDRPAELNGASVQFPGSHDVIARAVSDWQGGQELRRQHALFRLGLWCPAPDVRDRLAAFVDLALAGTAFLNVDGWSCRVQGSGGHSSDDGAAARAWRRDLIYRIEYPTTLSSSLPAMLFGAGSANGAAYVG